MCEGLQGQWQEEGFFPNSNFHTHHDEYFWGAVTNIPGPQKNMIIWQLQR